MYDHADALDDYLWPVCVTPNCKRRLWVAEAGRWACRPCEDRAAQWIAELPVLFRQLDTTAMLMKGSSRVSGPSGSKTPPIPPRIDVLNLVGPGGIAARLRDIEDAWRAVLGWTVAPWRGSPAEAIPQHASFLANNLLWACSSYEPVGQDIDDLRRLHGEVKAAAERKPKFGNVKIGLCPVRLDDGPCGEQLYASARSFKTACVSCGSAWKGEDEWRQLVAGQQRVLAEAAGVAA